MLSFSPYLFQIGFTSAPGQGGILAQREFDRRFSPHFVSTFQLVIEIALQQLQPSTAAFCQFVCGVFGLHYSHLEVVLQHGLQLIGISCPEEYHRKSKEFYPRYPCEGAGTVGFEPEALRVEDLMAVRLICT